jgi:hypothetical protein
VSFLAFGNGNSNCHSKETAYDILVQVALMGVGLGI